jgi:hypothetical protein
MAFWALPYKPEERVFDWDEKLALTNDMWIKLNGAIPKPVPSSLLHNWGEYAKVVLLQFINLKKLMRTYRNGSL